LVKRNEPGWYGTKFTQLLLEKLGGVESEVDKIKVWDGLYPMNPDINPVSRRRVVIQNDDHEQQFDGYSVRNLEDRGCIAVKNCESKDEHIKYETKLFSNPYEVKDNDNDWPIRLILSSFSLTFGNQSKFFNK
jgi:hypothetical protein